MRSRVVGWHHVRRWLRNGAVGFAALLVLLGAGRVGQKAWDSTSFEGRPPYLQQLTDDRVVVRWRSDEPYAGIVHVGPAPGQWTQTLREAAADNEHRLDLNGLRPDTTYYYGVGSGAALQWSGDEFHFRTAPADGADAPVRAWVVGDPGYNNDRQKATRAEALSWMKAHPRPDRPAFDLLLTTGDNAYSSGRISEFDRELLQPFAEHIRRAGIWPIYGNHDDRRWAFFDLFDFPERGEAGGVPSGTEHWYAFDYGPVHFVVLDSQDSSLDADGPMANWLERDLATSRQPWRLVLFHHPPYTKGSHDSDDKGDSNGRMAAMRENILPIFDRFGVDLVLTGHSHVYERSALIACHYGSSHSFRPAMVLDNESPYLKPASGPGGVVYAVVGASAKVNRGPFDHPANVVGASRGGSLIVDVEGNRLTGHYIDVNGKVFDRFVIEKSESVKPLSGVCG